jgi:hypothetical protein
LHDGALKRQRPLSPDKRGVLRLAQHALKQADTVIICLGGRSGRLGECIVGTALLEGILLALRFVGKAGTAIRVIIDTGALELFDERLYQEHYWPQIQVSGAPVGQTLSRAEALIQQSAARKSLVVDLHGAHDGMPYLRIEKRALARSSGSLDRDACTVTTLGRLFRVGVRSYAQRGRHRRYADFIEDVFDFPTGVIDGLLAQPRIWLSAADEARYGALAGEFRLRRSALQVVCFFQSIVLAKCYGRWREALTMMCQQVARRFPDQQIDFLVACGPDEDLPIGVKLADVADEFIDFTGDNRNVRTSVRATPSLRDLAIVVRHAALVLSNDTGPGHLAGALRIPAIVPYLPGQVYSKAVWASTPWHHGVTLEPAPFCAQQIEAAVLWESTDIIDSIPAERLAVAALGALETRLLSDGYKTPRSNATPGSPGHSTTAARCLPRRLGE